MTNEALMESCQYWIKLKYIDFKGIKNVFNLYNLVYALYENTYIKFNVF